MSGDRTQVARANNDAQMADLYSIALDVAKEWLTILLLTISAGILAYIVLINFHPLDYATSATMVVKNTNEDTNSVAYSGSEVFENLNYGADSASRLKNILESKELKAKYSERVSSLPRLRGVMLPGGDVKRDDFETLSKWGATLARYQMIRGWGKENDNQDVGEYVKWLDGRLDHLERVVLPLAREFGIRVVVDLHVPPGGRDSDGEMNMFHDAAFAECFVSCWRRIAKRFAGNSDIIYGYDLINEPQQMRRALENCDYWNLQRRAAEAARAADPETTIIIESNGWDAPSAFAYLSPLAMDNVIYQAHMYIPHEFTHQGVGGRKWDRCAYPDEKKGWNRAWLRSQIEPVVAFGKRHGARIYFGEFSAIAWADGADRYIADVASIFEECGFDWTYHAFREWQGWSVEHECDRPGGKFRSSDDNPRMRALRSALKAGR